MTSSPKTTTITFYATNAELYLSVLLFITVTRKSSGMNYHLKKALPYNA